MHFSLSFWKNCYVHKNEFLNHLPHSIGSSLSSLLESASTSTFATVLTGFFS